MKTRLLLSLGAAGLCGTTLLAPLSAQAAPIAPASASASSTIDSAGPKAIAPVSASLVALTPKVAQIKVTGGVQNATIHITDGDEVDFSSRVVIPGVALTFSVPVAEGHDYQLLVTQTFQGETSTPVYVHVDTAISRVAAPVVGRIIESPGGSQFLPFLVGVTGQPYLRVELTNVLGQVIGSGFLGADGSANISAKATTELPVNSRFFAEASFGYVRSPLTEARYPGSTDADDIAAPTVTVTDDNGFVTIVGNRTGAATGESLVVRGYDFSTLASIPFRGDTATAVLPSSSSATLLRVSTRFIASAGQGADRESTSVRRLLNDGQGSIVPDAPVIDDVEVVASRAVVTVTGEPGATVRITSSTGDLAATRLIGTSGSVQLSFTADVPRADFMAVQSIRSATSEALSFNLPTG